MRSTVRPSSSVLPSSCAVPALIASRSLVSGSRPKRLGHRSRQGTSVFGGTKLRADSCSSVPPNSASLPLAALAQEGAQLSRRRYLYGGVWSIHISTVPVHAGSDVTVASDFLCRITPAGGVSAACALSRKP